MKKILALDMGGTFIKWGIINNDGDNMTILEKGRFPTNAKHNSGLEIIWNMGKFASTMKKKHKDIKCVCSTIVGPFDTDRYVVLSHQSLKGYSDVNVKKEFAKYCKLPLYADNDVKAAALGELHSGALKGLEHVNAVVMAIGTGIAGCPIIDGKVYRGSNFSSGECGQMLVNNHHFEMYYGVPFFISRCEQIYGKPLTGEESLELAKTNVPVKREVDEWYDGIVKGIMYYIYLLNPQYVVLGGKITEHKSFDMDRIKKVMLRLAQKPKTSFEQVQIIKAKLGNDAALIGAACLCEK